MKAILLAATIVKRASVRSGHGINAGYVHHYDVQVKADYIGPDPHAEVIPEWEDWMTNTTETYGEFYASLDTMYQFRVRATDEWGNVEEWPLVHDSVTVVIGVSENMCDDIRERLEDGMGGVETKRAEVREELRERFAPTTIADGFRDPEEGVPPVSTVVPLFPVHLVMNPMIWPQNDDIAVQIYPYPPGHHARELLVGLGLLSESMPASIDVSWTGTDGPLGSDTLYFDVEYRIVEEGWYYVAPHPTIDCVLEVPTVQRDWVEWHNGTTELSDTFTIEEGGLYQFRCRATDVDGNREPHPAWDTSVYVIDLRHY